MEGLGEGDVAAVRQGSDHQAGCVPEVLVGVLELGVTDVGVAVPLYI